MKKGIVSLAFGLTVAVLCISTGCARKLVAVVPTNYVSFQPSDNYFVCDAPANWNNTGFASMGTESGANFISGPAKVNITSSEIGGILGDMATANASQAQNLADQLGTAAPSTLSPLDSTHRQFEAAMVHEHPDYAEQSAQPVNSPFGAGDMSEFTCDGGQTHGYRVTFLGKDRSIEIICQCPSSCWTTLQAPFQHIIQSVRLGSDNA
jgi:hypothetical protein